MEIQGLNGIVSILPQKGFGYSQEYGSAHFGYVIAGNFNQWAGIYRRQWKPKRTLIGYGVVSFGLTSYGAYNPDGSAFYVGMTKGSPFVSRMKFYWPSNPRTVAQQANRTKFANAITAWRGLTTDEKKLYNRRGRARRMSGMNLYIASAMRAS